MRTLGCTGDLRGRWTPWCIKSWMQSFSMAWNSRRGSTGECAPQRAGQARVEPQREGSLTGSPSRSRGERPGSRHQGFSTLSTLLRTHIPERIFFSFILFEEIPHLYQIAWHSSLDQARQGPETKVGLGAPLLTHLIISENWICSKSLPHPPPKNSHRTSKVGARIPN